MNAGSVMNPQVVVFIFARGGSKGVPGKNIKLLAGKPLIGHAIDVAWQSKYVDRVIVSTDDKEIARVSEAYGAEVPFMRPVELALDTSAEWLAWQHALHFLQGEGGLPEVFLSVPATAPLREACDLDACVELLQEGNHDIVITASDASRNPYFNMIKVVGGRAELAVSPTASITRRQDAPQFYDVATVAYAARPSFILEKHGLFEGRVGVVVLPQERTLDIDTLLDFKIADFLMREKQWGMLDEKYS